MPAKLKTFIGLMILVCLPLAGCSYFEMLMGEPQNKTESTTSSQVQPEPDTSEYPVELDRFTIREQPTKVVSLSSSLSEIITDLGYTQPLVGVSDYSYLSQTLPPCGTAQLPKFDAIEKLKPSVVFSSTALSEQSLIRLQQIDIQVVVIPPAVSIDGLREVYKTVAMVMEGKSTGVAKAERLFDEAETNFSEVQAQISAYLLKEIKPLSTIVLVVPDFTIVTGDQFLGELLKEIGVNNLGEGMTNFTVSEQALKTWNPEMIFYDKTIDMQQLAKTEQYAATDAVKNKALEEIDMTALESQSFRMFAELERMADILYPDAFTDGVSY